MGETSPTCTGMCPHCGAIVGVWGSLTVEHLDEHGAVCPGSVQNARCAESDRRPLWNGEPNPHLVRDADLDPFAEWRTHGEPVG